MSKKVLAAALLASMLSWSMHPLLPSSLLFSPHAPRRAETTSAHQHSCCPGAHTQVASFLMAPLPPASMPCGDRHPCCMQQGSDNAPALPAANTGAPLVEHLPLAIGEFDLRPGSVARVTAAGPNAFEFYSPRNTVLRI